MRSILHTVNIFTITIVVSRITVKLQSQSVGSKSTNSMQEHLGEKAKLFNFCSTPKAKGAGAIVFSAVKTAVNIAGGLSRRRKKIIAKPRLGYHM